MVRSTIDSVTVLDQDIKKAIINKEGVIAVFLDIKKPYDSMWKDGLLIKLHDAVVKGRMFYWIKDFLNNRSIQVKIRGDLAALNILLYVCQVERIKSFKFLGLWMDSRLTRKGHIEKNCL